MDAEPRLSNPRRTTDPAISGVIVAAVISMVTTTGIAFVVALGSGLASTQDKPVPALSNWLWGIGGYAFILVLVLMLAFGFVQTRATAYLLAAVLVIAGAAIFIGSMINGIENQSFSRYLRHSTMLIEALPLIVALIAGGVIVYLMRNRL